MRFETVSVVLLVINWDLILCYGQNQLSDKEYALMPDLFHLDDYDKCMLLEEEALYCTFTFQLKPRESEKNGFIWNIIQNVTINPKNYRHDLLRHGICVPRACPNATENIGIFSVKQVIEKCYNQKYYHMGLEGNVTNLKCNTTENNYIIDIYDVIVGLFLIFYVIFVIFASMYEGIARYQKKEVYDKITGTLAGKLIAAFSLPKNWHRLLSSNTNPDAVKLRSIQGIRFYNMICVILCHTIMVSFAVPVSNTKYTETLTNKALNMFIANGNYAVQTFFVISGWLLSFHFFQILEERKRIKFTYLITAFINRYMRLTPTLAVMIAFESTWLVHLGHGPNWDLAIVKEYLNCRKNWWTNLLYINNYVDKNNMCLHQTWYIAADTQLYMFSLLLLMYMGKNQAYIKHILGAILILGLLIQGGIAFFKEYDIVIRQYPENLYDLKGLRVNAWHDLYSSGYSSITGYAIGLTFGYLFYKYRNKVVLINKIRVVLWWFLTFGLCNFIILIASTMYAPDFKSTPLESALYWAFGKNLFALGIAIGIFGFSMKIGWFARWFVEWKSITILGRLTYSTYIVHVSLIRIRCGYVRAPIYINDYLLLMTTLGDIALSYLVGTLVCLMFEMPVSALQKLMIPQLKTKRLKGSSEKSLKTIDYDECDSQLKNQMSVCSKM